MSRASLTTLPAELLHLIARFIVRPNIKALPGPPTSLPALLLTCRGIYHTLSISSNPVLYAEIFREIFDFDADRVRRRRGGPSPGLLNTNATATIEMSPRMLAVELKTRFESMNRLRLGIGCRSGAGHGVYRERDLWTAVFMMMENEGKNAVQLSQYALIERWLAVFFMAKEASGSRVQENLRDEVWPNGDDGMIDGEKNVNALAFWLYWLYDSDPPLNYSKRNRKSFRDIASVYAVAANQYPIAPQWSSFHLSAPDEPIVSTPILYYDSTLYPRPIPIALSATLTYLVRRADDDHMGTIVSGAISYTLDNWDLDWGRWIRGQYEDGNSGDFSKYYSPGMLDHVWEGLFAYTDFETYRRLLNEDSPRVVDHAIVGRNLQVWKLREYFLPPAADILPVGPALEGFFPASTTVDMQSESDIVLGLVDGSNFKYTRVRETEMMNQSVGDVILHGEGHSSWGDFVLLGRIRREDAFVTLIKQYVEPHSRDRWLYHGYIIGGRLVGRWRDTVTRVDLDGYEGCFEMSQRICEYEASGLME